MKVPPCPVCKSRHQYPVAGRGPWLPSVERHHPGHRAALARCDGCGKLEVGVVRRGPGTASQTEARLYEWADQTIGCYPQSWTYSSESQDLLCPECQCQGTKARSAGPPVLVSLPRLPRHRNQLLLGRG